jgi:hypothetical protein
VVTLLAYFAVVRFCIFEILLVSTPERTILRLSLGCFAWNLLCSLNYCSKCESARLPGSGRRAPAQAMITATLRGSCWHLIQPVKRACNGMRYDVNVSNTQRTRRDRVLSTHASYSEGLVSDTGSDTGYPDSVSVVFFSSSRRSPGHLKLGRSLSLPRTL